jgi:hypothetical protein
MENMDKNTEIKGTSVTSGVVFHITLRDYFAANAVAGLLARHGGLCHAQSAYDAARDAYTVAEWMIKERNR